MWGGGGEQGNFIVTVLCPRSALVEVLAHQSGIDPKTGQTVKAEGAKIKRVAVPNLGDALKSAVEEAVQRAAKAEGFGGV